MSDFLVVAFKVSAFTARRTSPTHQRFSGWVSAQRHSPESLARVIFVSSVEVPWRARSSEISPRVNPKQWHRTSSLSDGFITNYYGAPAPSKARRKVDTPGPASYVFLHRAALPGARILPDFMVWVWQTGFKRYIDSPEHLGLSSNLDLMTKLSFTLFCSFVSPFGQTEGTRPVIYPGKDDTVES